MASTPGKSRKQLTTSLSMTAKLCSTCAFWTGCRQVKADCIQIHPYSKGGCQGGGFQSVPMAAMAVCDRWQPWLSPVSH